MCRSTLLVRFMYMSEISSQQLMWTGWGHRTVARLSKAWRPQGSPLLYDGSISHFTRMYSSGDPCGRHARMHQML